MVADAKWIASAAASALYWAKCRLAQPAGTPPLSPELAAAADRLARELQTQSLDAAAFFAHALPLCVHVEPPRQLVELVLIKLQGLGRTSDVEPLAREISALFRAFQQHAPGLIEELELRTGPLREQWEARGPGLLAMVRRLTEEDVAPTTADVILVRPIAGGGGQAFPPYNALVVEGVLTNSVAELPEVARLGWLWAQLGFDLPKFHEALGPAQLDIAGRLGLVPAVLAGAEQLELARLDAHTIRLALDTWEAGLANAELLFDWWMTYQESHAPWRVALAGLNRLLADRRPNP
jgi:hypothetical protein